MRLRSFFVNEFNEHVAVVEATKDSLERPFLALVELCVNQIRDGNKLLFFGNGGSAADAQHLATELTVRYKTDREAIAAIALTTDTSTLTAIGNDLGFDSIFSRQIEAIGCPGDVAIGISTSGHSPNVLKALRRAKEQGLWTAAFSGGTAGELPGLAEPLLVVPSATTARIQEMHITLGQMLCGAIEIELGLSQDVPDKA